MEICKWVCISIAEIRLAIRFVINRKDAKPRGCCKQSQIEELFIEVWRHIGIFSRSGC